jgi:hypothetical protein
MANLYSRTGATVHEEPGYGRFVPDDHGAFAFDDDLSDRLLRMHVRKKRMWEDEEMQSERLHQEAEGRHRDPAVLYAAVSELVQISRQAQAGGAVPADLAAELAELRKELAELREATGGEDAKPAPKGQGGGPHRSPAIK